MSCPLCPHASSFNNEVSFWFHHLSCWEHTDAARRHWLWAICHRLWHRALLWQQSWMLQVHNEWLAKCNIEWIIIPSCCRYEQTSMRQHFVACIEGGKMKPFPSTLVRGRWRFREFSSSATVRFLRMENGFYHTCRKWYHKSCQSIPDVVFDRTYKLWLVL